jgi:hypothetical protein
MIRGDFTSCSLPNGEVSGGWFAISHQWFDAKVTRRRARGRWYRLESDFGSTYRVLRFAPNIPYDTGDGAPSGGIAIDWDGWLDLQGRDDVDLKPLPLRIRRVRRTESLRLIWRHPDPSQRLALRLALLAFALGALSIVVAALPIL